MYRPSLDPLASRLALLVTLYASLTTAAIAVTYTYDEAGRLVGVDLGAGKAITYTYDKNGNLLNRTAAVATTADLQITKSTNTTSITGGANFDYTITVTNNGPDPATGVTVSDPFPPGLLVTSVSATQGSCTLTGQQLTCNLGVLGNGATATIALRVLHSLEGTFTNTATVSAVQADPDESNNTSSDTTTGTAPNDSDGDGMPNWWEERNGLGPFSGSGSNGPDGDRDRDGVRNFDEWLADTRADDRNSFLRMVRVARDGSGFHVTVESSAIRQYSLEVSPDLVTPFMAVDTQPGTGGELVLTDPDPPAGEGYYRVAVEILVP